ncbi:hypothetical protein ACSHWB_43480 [Lentzea sp. HUAS TT2]|uniref:hypothetical protein n=1 Tax=Lentzea sp. HUAS TT2 TaxID=3447454 RepID=UPI003F701316
MFARQAKRTAPVRYGFITRETPEASLPPAVALLRGATGGRGITGGDVRLRLMLSLLWAVHDDPTMTYPHRAWATLLGLEDPAVAGARRIRNALGWLDHHGLIQLESSPGRDAVVHLMNDAGTGERYELPGAAYARLRSKPAQAAPHRYIQLPGQLWTNGWIAALDYGPAIVMLLVLWLESGKTIKDGPWVWLSPAMAESRYGLSEDTRLKGARKLTELGLIKTSTRHVPSDAFEFRRGRNSYQIQLDTIQTRQPGETEIEAFFRTPTTGTPRSHAVPKPGSRNDA